MRYRRVVLRWSLLLLLPAALGGILYQVLPPSPRWSVTGPTNVIAVRPEGVLLHGVKFGRPIGPFVLCDPATGAVRQRFLPEDVPVVECKLADRGSTVVAWLDRQHEYRATEAWILDLAAGTEQLLPLPPTILASADTCQLASDGTRIAFRSEGKLVLWDAQRRATLDRPLDEVKEVVLDGSFTPDSTHYLAAVRGSSEVEDSTKDYVKVWSMRERRWAYTLDQPKRPAALKGIHIDSPSVQLSPEGRWLVEFAHTATPQRQKYWVVWDLARRVVVVEGGISSTDSEFCFLADGRGMTHFDPEVGRFDCWNLETGRRTARLDLPVDAAPPRSVAAWPSPDGRYLLSLHGLTALWQADHDEKKITLKVHDTKHVQLLWEHALHPSWISQKECAVFTPDSSAVIVTGGDPMCFVPNQGYIPEDGTPVAFMRTRIFDAATGKQRLNLPLAEMNGPGQFGTQSLTPDGRYCLVHHSNWVGIDFSPWRERLARWLPFLFSPFSPTHDRISVIDVPHRREVFRYSGTGGNRLIWNAEGNTLIVATSLGGEAEGIATNFRLACYDVPAQPSWCWVLGPPALLLAVLVGVVRWRRRKTKPASRSMPEGAPPC